MMQCVSNSVASSSLYVQCLLLILIEKYARLTHVWCERNREDEKRQLDRTMEWSELQHWRYMHKYPKLSLRESTHPFLIIACLIGRFPGILPSWYGVVDHCHCLQKQIGNMFELRKLNNEQKDVAAMVFPNIVDKEIDAALLAVDRAMSVKKRYDFRNTTYMYMHLLRLDRIMRVYLLFCRIRLPWNIIRIACHFLHRLKAIWLFREMRFSFFLLGLSLVNACAQLWLRR